MTDQERNPSIADLPTYQGVPRPGSFLAPYEHHLPRRVWELPLAINLWIWAVLSILGALLVLFGGLAGIAAV